MKTKKILFTSVIAFVIAVFAISSCKKEEEPAPILTPPTVSPTDSSSQTTRASDQTNVENESNQAMDEANDALVGVSTTREVQATCGYTIDSSQKLTGKIKLIYDGVTNCNGKIRSGFIDIKLPFDGTNITKWSAVGATASLTFNNYKVVYVADNKSLMLNGWHLMKNQSGGGWIQLAMGNTIIHIIKSRMFISFNGGTAIEWNSAKKRTLTYTGIFPNGLLKASMAGDTIMYVGSTCYTKVAMWGVNPMGDHFIINVPTDFSYDIINPINNNTCNGKPLTGVIKYYGIAFAITLTYGVDQYGYAITPGVCPWGYKIDWEDNNQHFITAKIAYPF